MKAFLRMTAAVLLVATMLVVALPGEGVAGEGDECFNLVETEEKIELQGGARSTEPAPAVCLDEKTAYYPIMWVIIYNKVKITI